MAQHIGEKQAEAEVHTCASSSLALRKQAAVFVHALRFVTIYNFHYDFVTIFQFRYDFVTISIRFT